MENMRQRISRGDIEADAINVYSPVLPGPTQLADI